MYYFLRRPGQAIRAGLADSLKIINFATPNYHNMSTSVLSLSPVTFTDSAISEIKRLMDEPDFDNRQLLRVGVKGGGCSGMSYILGFDEPAENDETFDIDGIAFIMNKSHGLYLMGMQIDWQNGLNARGFTFTNPNASKTCGCGSSFAV